MDAMYDIIITEHNNKNNGRLFGAQLTLLPDFSSGKKSLILAYDNCNYCINTL